MNKKKAFSLIISIFITLNLFSISINAKEKNNEVLLKTSEITVPRENLRNGYTVEEAFEFNNGTITNYNATIGGLNVKIPPTINGKKVRYISNFSFYAKKLLSVEIPNTVIQIGDYAFYYNNLACLKIPNSVNSLGKEIINFNYRDDVEYEEKSGEFLIDLKKLDPDFEPRKVKKTSKGIYNPNTGILTLKSRPQKGDKISYNYRIKNNKVSSIEGENKIIITIGDEKISSEIEPKAISDVAYYDLDELILEGWGGTNELFNEYVKKSIVIKSQDGQVKLEKPIENTDKYGNGYSGFKATLSKDDFDKIGDLTDGTIEIKIEYNGEIIILPYSINPANINSRVSTGYFDWESSHYNIEKLPTIEFGKNTISMKISSDNKVLLNNKHKNYGINLLAYYLNEKRYVLDIEVIFKESDKQFETYEKLFEVKNSNGDVVYTGKAIDFDNKISDTNPIVNLQIIVPAKYSTDEYNIELIVKDENGVEQYRFTNFPKWN